MFSTFSRLFSVFLVTAFLMTGSGGCSRNHTPMSKNETQQSSGTEAGVFVQMRERMVRMQLERRDIVDARVLEAMRAVPRHEFVPENMIPMAYNDSALPIDMGQTISQPYIVAFMTQALKLEGTERVLEIGTGSGYQAAVLAEIVPEVYSIEIIPELLEQADEVLKRLGYENVTTKAGDGYLGWPEHAPFDRIMLTAAPRKVPQPLLDQLKVGGILIAPVGGLNQELEIHEKGEKDITRRSILPVRFVPMTGKAKDEGQ
jgi:protein-L-isoaspartate(D-aspartate) O-methyltransferase